MRAGSPAVQATARRGAARPVPADRGAVHDRRRGIDGRARLAAYYETAVQRPQLRRPQPAGGLRRAQPHRPLPAASVGAGSSPANVQETRCEPQTRRDRLRGDGREPGRRPAARRLGPGRHRRGRALPEDDARRSAKALRRRRQHRRRRGGRVGARRSCCAVKPQDVLQALDGVDWSAARQLLHLGVRRHPGVAAGAAWLPASPSCGRCRTSPCGRARAPRRSCGGAHTGEADLDAAEEMLGAVGTAVRVPERLFDAVTALSGNGPAYLFLLAEAMADAGVNCGLLTRRRRRPDPADPARRQHDAARGGELGHRAAPRRHLTGGHDRRRTAGVRGEPLPVHDRRRVLRGGRPVPRARRRSGPSTRSAAVTAAMRSRAGAAAEAAAGRGSSPRRRGRRRGGAARDGRAAVSQPPSRSSRPTPTTCAAASRAAWASGLLDRLRLDAAVSPKPPDQLRLLADVPAGSRADDRYAGCAGGLVLEEWRRPVGRHRRQLRGAPARRRRHRLAAGQVAQRRGAAHRLGRAGHRGRADGLRGGAGARPRRDWIPRRSQLLREPGPGVGRRRSCSSPDLVPLVILRGSGDSTRQLAATRRAGRRAHPGACRRRRRRLRRRGRRPGRRALTCSRAAWTGSASATGSTCCSSTRRMWDDVRARPRRPASPPSRHAVAVVAATPRPPPRAGVGARRRPGGHGDRRPGDGAA